MTYPMTDPQMKTKTMNMTMKKQEFKIVMSVQFRTLAMFLKDGFPNLGLTYFYPLGG